jgi:broad specificity phosphatase PhoE
MNSRQSGQMHSESDTYVGGVYEWDYLFGQLTAGLTGPPIELNIVRHAQSVANARGLIAGQSDVDLTFRGYLQALVLGFRLHHRYDIACVSCLGRTHKTLQIAEALRFQKISRLPICADPRLDERSLGDLEGTPNRLIDAYAAGDLTYAPNRGESYLDLARRLLSFLVDLRCNVQRESRVVIATHVGPMRLLVGIIERLTDPRSVLGLKFSNAETFSGVLRDLTWPAFIRKEVLFERHRTKVGSASRAANDSQI